MSSLVLITGATGFIGAETLAQILDAGYRARIIVRRSEQIESVKGRYPGYADKIDFVVIPDLTDRVALQKALAGVDYAVHLASPMPGRNSGDLKTAWIDPAVEATVAILDAASKVASVKRVVITASVLSLAPVSDLNKPGFFVKEDTNLKINIDVNQPLPPPPDEDFVKYSVSKLAAHRATIEWVQKHKPAFAVITINPTYVIGHDRTRTSAVPQGVNALFLQSFTSEKPVTASSIVDVRDVGEAHLRALDVSPDLLKGEGVPGATEITEVLAGQDTTWDYIVKVIRNKYPKFPVALNGPYEASFRLDTRRAEKDFGIKWAPVEETIGQMLDQHLALQKA